MNNNYFLKYLLNEDNNNVKDDYLINNETDEVSKRSTHDKELVLMWFFKVLRELAILGHVNHRNSESTLYIDFENQTIQKKVIYLENNNAVGPIEIKIKDEYKGDFFSAVTKVFSHYKGFGIKARSNSENPPKQGNYTLVPKNTSEFETIKGIYQFGSQDITYRDNSRFIETER